jgi:tetratricopeptide (TPR) repeat protein
MSLFRKNDKDGKSGLAGSKGAVESKQVVGGAQGDSSLVRKTANSAGGALGKPAAAQGGGAVKPPSKKFERSLLGDITGPLDEALDEVLSELEANPLDDDLHKRRYEVVRRMGDRSATLSALEESFEAVGQSFYAVKAAALLEEHGDHQEALAWRLRVVEMHPADADAYKKLAMSFVRTGDLEGAEPAYLKLLELKKDSENPLGASFLDDMVGRNLTPAERSDLQAMGLRVIDAALVTHPGNVTALEFGARLAARSGNHEAANNYYLGLLDAHPHHANVKTWKGELLRVYARAGVPELWRSLSSELINDYKAHLKVQRSDVRSWIALARLQMQAGLSDDALDSFKSAVRADSREWQAVYEHGRLLVRMGRSDDAVRWYEDILDPFGSDAPEKKSVRRALERSLADLYFRLGRYNDSLAIYAREEEANVRFIAPIYEAAGETEKSEELYKKAVQQAPKDAKAHLALAEFYVRRGLWTQVESHARLGLECPNAYEETLEGLYVALATAQMNQRAVEQALATMDAAVEESPDSASMLFRKVKLLMLTRQVKEGRELAEQVRELLEARLGCAPANSAYWSLLGDCYSLLGHAEQAERAYSAAIEYDAYDSAAVRGLGVLSERRKDLDRALMLYKRFVVIDPLNLATLPIRQKITELSAAMGISG